MRLNEVLDRPAEWKENRISFQGHPDIKRDVKEYYFQVENPADLGPRNLSYSVVFAPVPGDDELFHPKELPGDVDYVQLTDMAGRDTITGSGAALKVFATTIDIIKKHKERTRVPIVIGSKRTEPSRVKLYSRMLDKIAKAKWKTKDEVQWLI
jgi:hypothetical protein